LDAARRPKPALVHGAALKRDANAVGRPGANLHVEEPVLDQD
jgi:hypothetical protein